MARKRFFTVLDKMIVSDLTKTVFSALLIIVVIIVSRSFLRVVAKAIEGGVTGQTLANVLGLKIIIAGVKLLPAAVFIGVIMVLGRMYRDQEMAALASAGAGTGVLYRAVFFFIVPLSAVLMILSMITTPWAEATIQSMVHSDMKTSDIRAIVPGRFSEYQNGELVFYVEEVDDNGVMHKVFVQTHLKGQKGVISSKTATILHSPNGRYIVFTNGERVQGKPGDLNLIIEKFSEYAVRLDIDESSVNLDRESISTSQLLTTQANVDIAEIQRRLSIPLGIIILTILAVPLAQVAPRGGVYGNIFTALVIYFAYSNLQKVCQRWVGDEIIPVWSGYILVYIVMLIVVGVLLTRLYGRKWVWQKLSGKVPK
jgi:lipopolysaccharide export system permease protein